MKLIQIAPILLSLAFLGCNTDHTPANSDLMAQVEGTTIASNLEILKLGDTKRLRVRNNKNLQFLVQLDKDMADLEKKTLAIWMEGLWSDMYVFRYTPEAKDIGDLDLVATSPSNNSFIPMLPKGQYLVHVDIREDFRNETINIEVFNADSISKLAMLRTKQTNDTASSEVLVYEYHDSLDKSRYKTMKNPNDSIEYTSTAICEDGYAVAAGSTDGQVIVWDISTQEIAYQGKSDNSSRITAVALSNTCNQVLASSSDGKISAWDRDGNLFSDDLGGMLVSKIELDKQQGMVAIISSDKGQIKLLNIETGELIDIRPPSGSSDKVLAYHIDGTTDFLIYITANGTTGAFDMIEFKLLEEDATGLALSSAAILEGGELYFGTEDGRLLVMSAGADEPGLLYNFDDAVTHIEIDSRLRILPRVEVASGNKVHELFKSNDGDTFKTTFTHFAEDDEGKSIVGMDLKYQLIK